MARTASLTFQQQASRAFGQLVRSIGDAQLRALMRAVFYRADRYQLFCEAPLTASGPDSAAGSAIRHAIRTGRLVRAVAGSFPPLSRDLMLAATLLAGVGVTEAFAWQGATVVVTARGKLYPAPILSALMVHDVRCAIDRAKRESVEGLILLAAWLAGESGVPAPQAGGEGALQHEAHVMALCMQLDRCAAQQGGERFGSIEQVATTPLYPVAAASQVAPQVAPQQAGAVRWSGSTSQASAAGGSGSRHDRHSGSRLTLVDPLRKEQDDDTTESRVAAG